VLVLEGTTLIYWLMKCNPNALFSLQVSQFKITTFIYWSIECNPNLYL
jgi:hypothetical protein